MYRYTITAILLVICGASVAQVGIPDSLSILRAALKDAPKDGRVWMRLGYAYLAVDSLKEAENAFVKAGRYAKSAEAYNGRGLVLMKKGIRFARKAFPHFRKALRANPAYIEAQLNIARTHTLLGEPDAERMYRKVMEMDSIYAPVYLELAQWYLDRGYEVYHDELSPLYEKYIALKPNDVEGHYGLALIYTDQKNYGAMLDVSLAVIRSKIGDKRWLALMAQAFAARGEPDKAMALFEKYLERIAPEERALYDDLSLVAFPGELKAYEAMPLDDREAFLKDFLRRRDLLLVSGGQARRAEHYRRVWYARTHFTDKVQPWDRRGEVYIRYGEPDYRSRYGFPNMLPPPAAEIVKERIAFEIGTAAQPDVRDSSPEGFFARSGAATYVPLSGQRLIEPVYPVVSEKSPIPWESWIYTDIGGGVEFTFIDIVRNGEFDFPPPPSGGGMSMRALSALTRNHPAVVLLLVASQTPEKFDIPPGMEPLEFYYDVAQFRGVNGETDVEVYFGVPPEQVEIKDEMGDVVRTLVLSDRDGEEVFRDQANLQFGGIDTSKLSKGAFVPELASLNVPPGAYKLAVQVTDRQSGKWGVYVQELDVVAFADSLAMSDLEMAWTIGEEPMGEKFRKGDVWVMPMPSRHYLHKQNVFVYYEVYNLTRNEFGQTKYRIDYTIQQDIRKGVGLFGALSAGMRKLIAVGKPQVVVSYEREGRDLWEPIYLELDMRKVQTGLNQVEVKVTDLVSGQSVSKRAMFRLSKEQKEEVYQPPEYDPMEQMMPAAGQ